jgi:hypothetical protein
MTGPLWMSVDHTRAAPAMNGVANELSKDFAGGKIDRRTFERCPFFPCEACAYQDECLPYLLDQ